ncbi:glycoside hydrolase family 95 protein [Fodinibius salsisoli]|uniref:Glycoside hydrolase N-terminal domain-containing protein n=1 Tax=Fodinibius salsisoli TaxID=2820877 RepID=A0ABT3PH66_9BACT|nr:glycoside hydrolase N-terminal domain-containing protein [Fodinibius salsisoli]MCW9705265.1 glycoside hydrolase N-terminal domain-containing protein [Fodinibius salsisoli]
MIGDNQGFTNIFCYASTWIGICILFQFLIGCNNNSQTEEKLILWYEQPATTWTEALPIGNGRLGAMIYGDPSEEHIQFNEETLWTGEPRAYHREGASKYLSEIRALLFQDNQDEAEALAQEEFMGRKYHEETYGQLKEEWLQKVRERVVAPENPSNKNYDDSNWDTMTVPMEDGWRNAGLEGRDGAVWFRTHFELPQDWNGQDLTLKLGHIRDQDFTYVNGQQIGSTQGKDQHRSYTIPASHLTPGTNTIAVQIINYFDKGGFTGFGDSDQSLMVYPKEADPKEGISLNKKWSYKPQDLQPPGYPDYMAKYQPFGDLHIEFDGHDQVTDYRRELDLANATAKTAYTVDGTRYTREYFASAPDQTIAIHLSADQAGKISFQADMTSPHFGFTTQKINENTLGLSVEVRNSVVKGRSYLNIQSDGGSIKVSDNEITVEGADEATLYLSAGTNFKNYKDVSGDPEVISARVMQGITDNSYDEIKSRHIDDYQQYFNTLSIDLGNSPNASLPTDERIQQFAQSKDPSLVALHMQYGRYLLISSSRPGTQPANLQGIWNDKLSPPWESKYTTNINVEMNYWPAELLNLPDLHKPLIKMTEELAQAGKQTAREHYDARGWVLHHNTDIWRGTAPVNASNHGIWVTGGAWLSHQLWNRFQFNQDTLYLEKISYPIMKEAAKFFVDFLVEDPDTGWLISTPSNSPEIGGLVAGPTMDHQLIRDLFQNSIAASKILDVDPAFRDTLQRKYERIAPNQIGKHGQLQEWLEDKDDPEETHRHVSHLWGLHPGNEINWKETPELYDAARQSLLFRGDGGTGWSLAWKINFWARFRDGDHAYKLVKKMLSPVDNPNSDIEGASYPNMFDAHPPFQIDGNFGGAAGVAEMLVQSHIDHTIDILPALPSALSQGSIKGIRARGSFELEMSWSEGDLQSLTVISKAGKKCTLRYDGKITSFKTEKGEQYQLGGDLNLL